MGVPSDVAVLRTSRLFAGALHLLERLAPPAQYEYVPTYPSTNTPSAPLPLCPSQPSPPANFRSSAGLPTRFIVCTTYYLLYDEYMADMADMAWAGPVNDFTRQR